MEFEFLAVLWNAQKLIEGIGNFKMSKAIDGLLNYFPNEVNYFSDPNVKQADKEYKAGSYAVALAALQAWFVKAGKFIITKVLKRGNKLTKEIGEELNEKISETFNKSMKSDGKRPEVDKAAVNEQRKKLQKDLDNSSNEKLLDAMTKDPELVDAWKKLDDEGMPDRIRKSPIHVKVRKMVGDVHDLDKVPDGVIDELSKLGKISKDNIKDVEKALRKYEDGEVGFIFGKDGKVLAGPIMGKVGADGRNQINIGDAKQRLQTKDPNGECSEKCVIEI